LLAGARDVGAESRGTRAGVLAMVAGADAVALSAAALAGAINPAAVANRTPSARMCAILARKCDT